MLKHVVMWKFRDEAEGVDRKENLRQAKSMLDSLPGKIPAIRNFEVGIDVLHGTASYDLVLISAFEDAQGLLVYQTHPAHMDVVKFLRKVQSDKVVVDYVQE